MARRSPNRLERFAAFTLLEVLVALAIFALGAIYLASSYVNILNAYARASKGGGADPYVQFARQQLLTQTDLATAQLGDEFDTPDNPPYAPTQHVKWTADIETTSTTDLFTVTFTCVVSPPGGATGNARTEVETFMLLRPTWSVPTDRTTVRQNNVTAIAQLQGLQAK
jgi:general secretion pathway protein I